MTTTLLLILWLLPILGKILNWRHFCNTAFSDTLSRVYQLCQTDAFVRYELSPMCCAERPGSWRYIVIITPYGNGHIAQTGYASMCGVERHRHCQVRPVCYREDYFDPGVRPALSEHMTRNVEKLKASYQSESKYYQRTSLSLAMSSLSKLIG